MIWAEKAGKLPRRKQKEREERLKEINRGFMIREYVRHLTSAERLIVVSELRRMGDI